MAIASDHTTSRRERKKLATRGQIKAIATELFREQGFENVTIAQIAEAADVDVTTFWRHFRSKLAILCSDQELWAEQFRYALARIPHHVNILDAAIQALVATPPVGQEELLEIRRQLARGEPSPETRSAILAIDDMIRAELALALADRLGVGLAEDPRPSILSGAIVGATHWYSEYNFNNPNAKPDEGGLVIAGAVRSVLKD